MRVARWRDRFANDPLSSVTWSLRSSLTGPGTLFSLRSTVDPSATEWTLNLFGEEGVGAAGGRMRSAGPRLRPRSARHSVRDRRRRRRRDAGNRASRGGSRRKLARFPFRSPRPWRSSASASVSWRRGRGRANGSEAVMTRAPLAAYPGRCSALLSVVARAGRTRRRFLSHAPTSIATASSPAPTRRSSSR